MTRRESAAILSALLLTSIVGIFDHGLWTPDEPRDAEISREMAVHGLSAAPTLNREPFLEKPPLYYWATAAALRILGAGAGPARLPSVLFGAITLAFTFLLARRMAGREVALRSTLILAGMALYFIVTHRCLVDNAMVAFTTGAFYLLHGAVADGKGLRNYLLAYACAAAAFLSKGLIGTGLVAAGFLGFLLWSREYRGILRAQPWWAALLLVAVAGTWTAFLTPAQRSTFWIDNHVGRFTGLGRTGGHVQPVYYYGYAWLYAFAPWTLLVPSAVAWAWRDARTRPSTRFLLSWLGAGFVVLTVSATKRELYLLPLCPALAILLSIWMDAAPADSPWTRLPRIAFTALLVLGHVAAWGAAIYVRNFWGLAALVALEAGLFAVRRSAWPTRVGLATAALFVGSAAVLVPYGDSRKDLSSFCRSLPRMERVPAYRPDETTRAIIPFYTGSSVRSIGTLEEAEAAARVKPAFIVVVSRRRD
ncbi:MAG TPA: glycosyltransferase family 39 protein, partial [Planctomycetota bacterium]|nr:glycosyltransferase family 39 protein [Planctomycetota bacterium]